MISRKLKLGLAISVLILATMACSIPSLSFFQRVTEESSVSEEVVEQVPQPQATPMTEFVIPNEVLLQDALVALYERVSPGVVSIQVNSRFGAGLGSGFVVDKQGHIVTNYHVVDGAEEVEVHFQSGLKVYGEVIGEDLDSDLAVIKVDVDPSQLYPLTLGDSDQVLVGQTVIAIGNPYGLSGTMTTGIVSARGRTLESIRQAESGAFFSAGDLIQTDATINPGNSGGPLLNLNGEVVGINRAIQTSGMTVEGGAANTGIGFAVSSNILRLVLPSLIESGTYSYPYLGLSALSSLTLAGAEQLGISQATGAYVAEIVPGGPADEAGLRAGDEPTQDPRYYAGGDLIVGVDGRQILQFSDMLSYMMLNKQPGDEITLTVLRDGQEMDFTVVLGERPANGN